MTLGIIIVAGGKGVRCGLELPKQYVMLGSKTVLEHSLHRFQQSFPDAVIALVIHNGHRNLLPVLPDTIVITAGGDTRQASVWAGLKAIAGRNITQVLIHDAARPFVNESVCHKLLAALESHEAAVPVLPVSDTVKLVEKNRITRTVDREGLFTVQTPQAFHYERIYRIHHKAHDEEWNIATDDAGLCERAGVEVAVVSGDIQHFKITTQDDMQLALKYEASMKDIHTGLGYDVHRLLAYDETVVQAEKIIRLGGIAIPHTHYLEGHSDADVVLHALTDALLGAACAGDIGQYFPPSDMRYKGADSELFVNEAVKLLHHKGADILHADITIICEAPKIGAYREQMQQRIATMLGIAADKVNIKATTTEGLGFTGRKEGIASQAIVTVRV